MNYTEEFLIKLQDMLKPNSPKSEYAPYVKILDARVKSLLNELRFDPAKVEHIQIMGSANERQTEMYELMSVAKNTPAVMLPLAIDALIHDISTRIRKDLLLSTHEFLFYHGILKFRISTSSFAMTYSDRDKAEQENRVRKQLEIMKGQGYSITEDRNQNLKLQDSELNRELLAQYIKTELGASVSKFISRKGRIDSIECSMSIDRSSHAFLKSEKIHKPASETLSENDIGNLTKAISDCVHALHVFPFIKDSNLVLSILRSKMHEIEGVLNYKGLIWREVETEIKQERNANIAVRRMKEEVGKRYANRLKGSFSDYYEDIELALSYQMHRLAFSVSDLRIEPYETIRFDVIPAMLYSEPELDVPLDGILDIEFNRCFYVKDTPENVQKIEFFIASLMKKAHIEQYTVKNEKCRYISKISVIIRPMDINDLLDSVKGIDRNELEKRLF